MFTNSHANCRTKVSQKSMIPANSDNVIPESALISSSIKKHLIKYVVEKENMSAYNKCKLASHSKNTGNLVQPNHLDKLDTQSHPCILNIRGSNVLFWTI